MKIPTLASVAETARKRPFRAGDTLYRHVVTVYVDTAEVNTDRVKAAVQSAVDEVTGTIQDNEDVTFDEAHVVSATRTESDRPRGQLR